MLLDRGDGMPERIGLDIAKHYVETALRELVREREPEPARTSGDDRDLAGFELHVRAPSWSVVAEACHAG